MNDFSADQEVVWIDGLTIHSPERLYDFSSFASLRHMVEPIMACLVSARSENEKATSRKRTNVGLYKVAIDFLKFAQFRGSDGTQCAFDRATYESYAKFNEQTRAPTSEVSNLNHVRRLFRFALAASGDRSVSLPAAKSAKAALATSRGSATLADFCPTLPVEVKDRRELNILLMSQLSGFCWERIHQIRDRCEKREAWIIQKYAGGLLKTPHGKRREDVVRNIVTYLWSVNDGYMPQTRSDQSAMSEAQRHEQRVRKQLGEYLRERCGRVDPPITIFELSDYMKPSHRQIAPFLPLFAMKGINPVSTYELETSMLVDGIRNTKLIKWEKQRAGRELIAGPWEIKGKNSRTIPRAWEVLEHITSSIRREAKPEYQKYLFLCSQHRRPGKGSESISPLRNYVTMHILNKEIQASKDPRWDALRSLSAEINLKLVRTTAGGLKRFLDGFDTSKEFFNHRAARTTDRYLNNQIYKAHLDDQIIVGQKELHSHFAEKPTLVANDPKMISRQQLMSREDADALVSDQLNLGFGISLVREHAFVVDTPLNYLRMSGWLAKMEEASERLALQNAERWELYWKPQIDLFSIALDDFPRTTRAAAKCLRVDLSFPEPH